MSKSFMERTTVEQRRMYRRRSFDKALALYAKLIKLLGNKCAWCGKKGKPGAVLTLDHERGKTYRARKLRLDARIRRYWLEYQAGVPLRVLCYECNSRDGRWRQTEGRVHAEEEIPF